MSEIVKSNPQKLNEMLQAPSVQSQFDQALGDSKGTFISSLLSLYTSDTKLSECNPNEVIVEALKAASLRLPLDKNLGLAYVIPYNKKVGNEWKPKPEFQIGYKGLIQLAMRSGVYKTFNADKVYEGELKSHNKLTGEIDLSGDRTSDKVVGYFAYLATLNGFEKTVYMSVEDAREHGKTYSKTYNFKGSTWQVEFDKMALKTVIIKLLKMYGQLSIEEQMILGSEEDPIKNDIESRTDEPITIEVVDTDTGEIVEEDKDKAKGKSKEEQQNLPY